MATKGSAYPENIVTDEEHAAFQRTADAVARRQAQVAAEAPRSFVEPEQRAPRAETPKLRRSSTRRKA